MAGRRHYGGLDQEAFPEMCCVVLPLVTLLAAALGVVLSVSVWACCGVSLRQLVFNSLHTSLDFVQGRAFHVRDQGSREDSLSDFAKG